jgi:hypothetical protein
VNLLRNNKKFSVILLMSLLMVVFVPSAMAFEGREGANVTIEADEVINDDLYVATDVFILNGTVKGDLFVGATQILINGNVEGDLFAGGQSIEINGTILGDARLGGTAIELGEGAEIGEDLLAFGYSVHSKSGSQVGSELIFGGFQALVEGDVASDAWIGANSFELNGRIGGNVQAEVGSEESEPPIDPYQFMPDAPTMPTVPSGLTLGNDAEIGGNLNYRAPSSYDVSEDAVGGNVDFTEEAVTTTVDSAPSTGEQVWRFVRRFITLALIGALLVWRTPSFINRLNSQLQEKPLPSLGWGAIVYFAVPIIIFALVVAAILIALLLGGLQFGNLSTVVIFVTMTAIIVFMMAFVLVLLYLTKIIIGYYVGQFILERVNPSLIENPYLPLLVGLLLVVIVISLPLIGGLVNWLIAMVGVGALWLLLRSNNTPQEKAVA